MRPQYGNQHWSRKALLLAILRLVRKRLAEGRAHYARAWMETYRTQYARVPAGTRRRWKCGK